MLRSQVARSQVAKSEVARIKSYRSSRVRRPRRGRQCAALRVRQSSAKLRHVMSVAAPENFIFSHSAPQACICSRVATGSGGSPRGGVVTIEAVGGVGAAMVGAVTAPVAGAAAAPKAAGRGGGNGITAGSRFAAVVCARATPASSVKLAAAIATRRIFRPCKTGAVPVMNNANRPVVRNA